MKSDKLSNAHISNGVNPFIFNARLVAPYFTEIPPEIREKWVSGSKKAVSKTYKGLKKAIKTRKDFNEKIGEPTKKTIASFINPEWTSKHGLTYKDIINKTRDSLAGAGKRYFRSRKAVYESGKYEEKLELGQKEYARKWCQYLGPLRGYNAGNILGLSTMAMMALTGDRKLVDYLKERNIRVEGKPRVVATPEKLNKFRRILDNRIVHWGSEIINLGYEEQVIKRANQDLNQLVNDYRCPEIIPFSPGGASPRNNRDSAAASHIDFIIVEEIPACAEAPAGMPHPLKPGEPARPDARSGGKIKQLGLEIQVVAGH